MPRWLKDRHIPVKQWVTPHKSCIHGVPCIVCRQFSLSEKLQETYHSRNLGEGSNESCKFQEIPGTWVVCFLGLNYSFFPGWHIWMWEKLWCNLLNGILMYGRSPDLKFMSLYHPPSIGTCISSELGTFDEPIHSNLLTKQKCFRVMLWDLIALSFYLIILIVFLDHSLFFYNHAVNFFNESYAYSPTCVYSSKLLILILHVFLMALPKKY